MFHFKKKYQNMFLKRHTLNVAPFFFKGVEFFFKNQLIH